MTSYTLTKAAQNDLRAIAEYTVQNFGIEQAITYRDGITKALIFLVENPKAARLRTELNPPMRIHRFQSHIIIYEEIGHKNICVIRIRHGKEDWGTELG